MRREREREEKNGLFVFIVVLIALYTYLPGKFKVCSKVNFATHTALKSPKNVSYCVAFFKLTNALTNFFFPRSVTCKKELSLIHI